MTHYQRFILRYSLMTAFYALFFGWLYEVSGGPWFSIIWGLVAGGIIGAVLYPLLYKNKEN